MMKLVIEFPMVVAAGYHGISNLDATLDDHISYLIGKYFYDHKIHFRILKLDFIEAKPNTNEKLIRYEVELGINETEFKYEWILKELKEEGFEKGLTIKSSENELIYSGQYIADIPQKRKLKGVKPWKDKLK